VFENIKLVCADITQADVDAIVNAANPAMLGGGGVDGAIHRAAGPALLDACRKVPTVKGVRCPTGEARITVAGNLNANYVIHTVGPVYRSVDESAQLLALAYANACKLALENHCRLIAFPAISCGVYGYPHQAAAQIAIDTCGRTEFSNLQVRFYLLEPRGC